MIKKCLFVLNLLVCFCSTMFSLKEAMFYIKLENNKVQCKLCPRECVIALGKRGFCRVRENQNGKLYSLVYGMPCSVDIGPIEKAPLYHFYPGHKRLCLATVSCNLRCKYCHNWHISQIAPEELKQTYQLSPQEVINLAKKYGLGSISFTYTEPTVFYEYIYDISKLAKEQGIKTSIVSNGFINPEPLKKLIKVLDAVKIDLKGFSEKFYQQICSAELKPVLRTLEILKQENKYFEIVNLIIPTLNDSEDEIREMCRWIKEKLGDEVPIHFTRFSPAYKLIHLPPTPIKKLEKAHEVAKEVGLKYVYIGNVPGHKYNSTYCPKCKKLLIERCHFEVRKNEVVKGKCKYCGKEIVGIWE